ncbi:MAG TPA: molybdate ABC transporter substrate-binding protein [Bryobacteraceae bacterium]|nr:molybdate ABC transporter substrate-binding protein [Bryobacteraceae bacterium]
MRLRSIALLFIVASCAPGGQPERSSITIAAAANLVEVAQAIGSEFEAQTKIHPVFSFGSTAVLTTQIENSAPFDVFLAADAEHIDKLDQEGLLVKGSSAIYAVGVLALWIPPGRNVPIGKIADLNNSDVHVIALANPKLAPYGAAAVETLQHAGIWDQVQAKVVYAENISMAKQYGTSKNADAVFTAYSLVLKEAGKVIPVDESLHQPIVQKLGVIARTQHRDEAQSFTQFVLHGPGSAILNRFGYHQRSFKAN